MARPSSDTQRDLPADSMHANAASQDYAPGHWRADDDEIDLFELMDILWEGKWLIIVAGLLCTLGAVIYALTTEETYQAKVVMVPADSGNGGGGLSALAGQFGGLASLAGINIPSGGNDAATAIEILESFQFSAAFIQENDLLPTLFAEQWSAEARAWSIDSQEIPTLQKAVKKFQESRSISTDKQSGAVTLTVEWTNPELAADWANMLVAKLNSILRQKDVEEAEKSVAYLRGQLSQTTNVDMKATLYRLIESQTQTIMLANVRDDYVFRVVDPAYVPEQRAKPKRAFIVVLGGMLGGMFGVLLVFGRRVVHSYHSRNEEV